MPKSLRILVPACLAAALLAGCNTYNENYPSPQVSPPPATVTTGSATSSSDYTLAQLPTGYVMTPTAGQGLAAVTISNGTAVNTGSPATTTAVTSFTSMAVESLSTPGYFIELPDKTNYTLSTASGSSAIVSANQLKGTDASGTGDTINVIGPTPSAAGLSYSEYGTWIESSTSKGVIGAGVFATGTTPVPSEMPTSGSATYTGGVAGVVFTSTGNASVTGGTVALSATFGSSGTITGTVTNITTASLGSTTNTGQLNDINLTGGTITGFTFAGTATPAAATSSTTINIASATGTFGGQFHGPNAAEAAGQISLSGGGTTALLAFGAHH